jgi:hypothetical protein
MRAEFWVMVAILWTLWVMLGVMSRPRPPAPPVPVAPRPMFLWTAPAPVT